MKKYIYLSVSLTMFWLTSAPVFADNISNNFSSHLNQNDLDEFSKDLGALVNGGSFHDGKALGFPLGFDVGIHGVGMKIDSTDPILRDDGSDATALSGQAEIGLPWHINVIARGGKTVDVDYIGGGLRFGIFTSKVPLMPSVSVSALYNKTNHDFFDGESISGNLVASMDIPFIKPYLGVGYDQMEVKPTSRAYQGVAASVPRDLKAKTTAMRAEIGVNISLLPFSYINLGVGQANGQNAAHVGLGVKF